jgi:FHA domain
VRYQLVIVRSSIDGLAAGARLEIPEGRAITLGRGRDSDIVVPSPDISRRHLRLAIVDGALDVEYLGNWSGIIFENATCVRARVPVGGRFELKEGCELELSAESAPGETG